MLLFAPFLLLIYYQRAWIAQKEADMWWTADKLGYELAGGVGRSVASRLGQVVSMSCPPCSDTSHGHSSEAVEQCLRTL
jgi:hypothetical protein